MKLFSVVSCLAGICLLLLGLSGLTLRAEPPPAAQVSGGIVDPLTQTYDAVVLVVRGQTGQASLTTQASHYYGTVTRAVYTPGHVYATAKDYFRPGNTLVIDADANTQTLFAYEVNANGEIVAGDADAQPIHGKISIP